MKKLCLAAAGLLCLFTACNNGDKTESAADNSMAQKNIDACSVVNKAFETGDASQVDSVVATDFVDHTDKGDKGRDSLKAVIQMMHNSDKTMKLDVVKRVADNDYVFEMVHYSGTGDGVMMPAGPYDMHTVEVIRFKDGKAVEHWGYADPGEMMKMMGTMKQMEGNMQAAGKDTTMHH